MPKRQALMQSPLFQDDALKVLWLTQLEASLFSTAPEILQHWLINAGYVQAPAFPLAQAQITGLGRQVLQSKVRG